MAFLDKFNEAYVRSIPESGPGISVDWREPVIGTRYRWQKNRDQRVLWLAAIFLFLWMIPSVRYHDESMLTAKRLLMAAGITGIYALLGWAFSHTRARILLTARHVIVGAGGRGARRIRLDTAHVVTLEVADGKPVLLVRERPEAVERIYLDPSKESEVRELLTKAGRLKIA